MKKYITRQIILILPTLLIVSVIAFAMIRLLPSDAVDTYLLANHLTKTEENVKMAEVRFGLDKPAPVQYVNWVKDICHLDFGQSYTSNQEVSELLWRAFCATMQLALAAMIWILVLTPVMGIMSARKPHGLMDKFTRIFCLMGTAVPSFVLGFFLIRFFGVKLKLLPISGKDSWLNYILPSFTLALSHIASFVQMLRNELLENRNGSYTHYAMARGIKEKTIFHTHILKNSMLPVVNSVGISIGRLIAGTVVIENVFSWPGLGQLITKSILARDYPVIQAYILLIAIVFIVANLFADLLSAFVDPRIRLGEK